MNDIDVLVKASIAAENQLLGDRIRLRYVGHCRNGALAEQRKQMPADEPVGPGHEDGVSHLCPGR